MAIPANEYETTTDTGSYRAGSAIEQYHAVSLDSERTVVPLTSDNADAFVGVAVTSAAANEEVGVKYANQFPVAVGASGGSVSAPTHLFAGSEAGVLAPMNDGDTTGQSAGNGLALAVTDEDANGLVTANLNR